MTRVKTLDFFEQEDYRQLLRHWLETQPGGGHGERSKLAKAMQCHNAYVTHVLKGLGQLSPEQALRASRHMGHSDDEMHYFLALVSLDRAGSEDLKAVIRESLKALRRRRKHLKTRFKEKQ